MKKLYYLCIGLLFSACADTQQPTKPFDHFYAPPKGSIIAADSTPIKEDMLNEFYYSAELRSTASSNEGSYMLKAAFGPNKAQTEVVYPKLQQQIVPTLKLDTTLPYSYHVGFTYKDDSFFHEYAKIFVNRTGHYDMNHPAGTFKTEIQLRYTKTYFVDSSEIK